MLNHRVVLDAIDATPARRRGGVNSSPLDRAMTAASSPRDDLVKNCAPDTLVDFHTGRRARVAPFRRAPEEPRGLGLVHVCSGAAREGRGEVVERVRVVAARGEA